MPMNLAVGIGCKKEKFKRDCAGGLYDICAESPADRANRCDCIYRQKGAGTRNYQFCKQMKVPYRTYAAQELEQQAGTFTASSFVKGQMGVDNVCERSACAASGGGEK